MGCRTKTCKNKTKKHNNQNKKNKKNNKNNKNKKKHNKKTHHGGIFRELFKSPPNELTRFNDFINIISSSDLTNATILMGIDYKCENDLNRNIEVELHPDFCWSKRSDECRHGTTMDQWYQLYFPFKIEFIELSPDGSLIAKNIVTENLVQLAAYFKTPTLNKFKKIIFDASTVKFLFRIAPSFIAYLYYYFLEENGELYFNINANAFNGTLSFIPSSNAAATSNMQRIHDIVNSLTPSNKLFGKKFIIRTYRGITAADRISSLYEFNPDMQQIIVQNNIEYFRRNLMHSSIEQFDANEQVKEGLFHQSTYPIRTTNYSIGSYLKITKKPGVIDFTEAVFLSIYNDQIAYQTNSDIMHWVLIQSFEESHGLNCVFV